MAEKPTILYVGEREALTSLQQLNPETKRYNMLYAVLHPREAEGELPLVDDILGQLKRDGTQIDGIILFDSSYAADNKVVAALKQRWDESRLELERLEQPEAALSLPPNESETNFQDPVLSAATRLAAEQDRVSQIGESAEKSMLDGVHDRGLHLIAHLRKDNAFQHVPIIVNGAWQEKAQQFKDVGATAVVTSHDSVDRVNAWQLLADELGARAQSTPKNPIDYAVRESSQKSR